MRVILPYFSQSVFDGGGGGQNREAARGNESKEEWIGSGLLAATNFIEVGRHTIKG